MDKEERSVRKKHWICFSFDCVLGLPAFFPGIIPDLQPVYKVNNHNIRYQWQTTRKKIAELTVFVLRLKNKCKWFTCNTCLTVLASGRCGSWILQRCQTRFSSLPHGAFTVSSWWVFFYRSNNANALGWVFNYYYSNMRFWKIHSLTKTINPAATFGFPFCAVR